MGFFNDGGLKVKQGLHTDNEVGKDRWNSAVKVSVWHEASSAQQFRLKPFFHTPASVKLCNEKLIRTRYMEKVVEFQIFTSGIYTCEVIHVFF